MKLFAAILLSSGVFLFLCAVVFFVNATKQTSQQGALNLMGPGFVIGCFAVTCLLSGALVWKKT